MAVIAWPREKRLIALNQNRGHSYRSYCDVVAVGLYPGYNQDVTEVA